MPKGPCLSVAMWEFGQNCTIPDPFLCLQGDASFGRKREQSDFSVLECGVGWMGLWVEERKALSRAAEGEVAMPILGPVFPSLPPFPPPFLASLEKVLRTKRLCPFMDF